MKSFFLIKYFFNSLLFFFMVKKNNNLQSYFNFSKTFNEILIRLFFCCRILPTIFFYFYNKIAYFFSHFPFAITYFYNLISPFIKLILKSINLLLKLSLVAIIYVGPIIFDYLKNNFLIFTKKIKIRKLFFINNLYNSFSSKILLSGTAFFSIYILILIILLTIIVPFFVVKQTVLSTNNVESLEIFLPNGELSLFVKSLFSLSNTESAPVLSLAQLNFNFYLGLCIFLFIILNVIHSFLAFLSLCYDYLLKKLNSQNFFVLFIISSTTLQIFFKLLTLILIL